MGNGVLNFGFLAIKNKYAEIQIPQYLFSIYLLQVVNKIIFEFEFDSCQLCV